MGRELKFRFYNLKSNKMILGESGKFNSKDLIETDKWKVMQYVGIKDLNGVDIYEDDILEIYEEDEDSCCGNVIKYKVKIFWDRYQSTYRFNDGKYYVLGNAPYINLYATLSNFRNRCEFKVIGNIYENINLLKD